MKSKILRGAACVPAVALIIFLIHLAVIAEDTHTPVDTPDPARIYDSFLDLPLFDMAFADDEVFSLLKEAYGNAEFFGGFKREDVGLSDFFKGKYLRLLDSDAPFTEARTGTEHYLSGYEYMAGRNPGGLTFYFFDMDGDGAPELGIGGFGGIYIFKYIAESDRYVLWRDMSAPGYSITGSRKITWDHFGTGARCAFYQLDENGETEYSLFFLSEEGPGKQAGQAEVVYVLTLPIYGDENEQIRPARKIAEQACLFHGGEGIMYAFRVTQAQYEELTGDYFGAAEAAEKQIDAASFTYEALFGTKAAPLPNPPLPTPDATSTLEFGEVLDGFEMLEFSEDISDEARAFVENYYMEDLEIIREIREDPGRRLNFAMAEKDANGDGLTDMILML